MTPSMQGSLAAVVAYVSWGLFPIYFKQLGELNPIDIVAWRTGLCVVFLSMVLLIWLKPRKLWQQLRLVNQWGLLFASTFMLSTNWLVFIYAMGTNQVVQSSLGYFLVPIFSVGLGMVAFAEKPNILKRIAVVIAAVGMMITFLVAGEVPWIALYLGLSFGLYGMFRKQAKFDSAIGLFLETLILLPFALVFFIWFSPPVSELSTTTLYWALLLGVVTSVPLLAMIFAARRIELSALGFYQYITPTMHMLLAILVFNESLDIVRLLALITTLIAVCFWMVGSLTSVRQMLSSKHRATDTSR